MREQSPRGSATPQTRSREDAEKAAMLPKPRRPLQTRRRPLSARRLAVRHPERDRDHERLQNPDNGVGGERMADGRSDDHQQIWRERRILISNIAIELRAVRQLLGDVEIAAGVDDGIEPTLVRLSEGNRSD